MLKKIFIILLVLSNVTLFAADKKLNTVSKSLINLGFIEVQLLRNGLGQFETFIELDNGEKLRVLVDTGSSKTFFDMKKMKELNYNLKDTNLKVTTMAGELETKTTDIKNIRISNANTGPMTLYLIDLDYINKQLISSGSNSVDGVFGSDLLVLYSAVIDVKNSRMYLRVH